MYWTHYSENIIMNSFLGTLATAPTNRFAGLMLSNPGNTGAGTEISYSGYVRQPLTFNAPTTSADRVVSIANATDVLFPESQVSAGVVTHVAIFTSSVGGNMLCYMQLDEPIEVVVGVAPLIVAQEWVYRITGNASVTLAQRMLNWLRSTNIIGFTAHCALFNNSPDVGGAELAGSAYARVPLTFSTPAIQAAGHMRIQTNADLKFARALSNWGTWNTTAIYDAASGGSPLLIAPRSSIVLSRGRQVTIAAGDLAFNLN